MGPILCAETSVRNYHHYTLRNNPEERSSLLLIGGSQKSRTHLCVLRHGVSSRINFLARSHDSVLSVAATQCVRMERLTVSGNKLLIVVYFRHKSACKVQQVPLILYSFSFEELFVNMSVALVSSICNSFCFVKMSVASTLSTCQ